MKPSAFISASPLPMPAMVQPSPTDTTTQSGSRLATLLRDLEAGGLLPLHQRRVDGGVAVVPAVTLAGALAELPRFVVAAAALAPRGRRTPATARASAGRELRNEDHARQAYAGGGARQRGGRVAGRGARHHLRAAQQRPSHADGAGAILERRGRVAPLVLDQQPPHAGPLREPRRVEDRRPARLDGRPPRAGGQRQQLLVAPGGERARAQRPRCHCAPGPHQVELDLQDAFGPAGAAGDRRDRAPDASRSARRRSPRAKRPGKVIRPAFAARAGDGRSRARAPAAPPTTSGSSWARSSATVFPCCSTQVKYFWLCQRRRTAGVLLEQQAAPPRAEDPDPALRLLEVHRPLLRIEPLQHGRVAVETVGGDRDHRLARAEAVVRRRADRRQHVADAADPEHVDPRAGLLRRTPPASRAAVPSWSSCRPRRHSRSSTQTRRSVAHTLWIQVTCLSPMPSMRWAPKPTS